MFDFGADARNEGGENGQNHKGLVTFDRKYKKDSFYAYKAWLSDEPFVHLCGKRYVDRVEDTTKVTVYSNLPEVELFVNGKSAGKLQAEDHFFHFEVPNVGESTLVAVAGEYKDESHIRKVDTFNEEYSLKESGAILNWFDITEPEGYYSLNDRLSDIMKSEEGKALFMGLMSKVAAGMSQGNEKNDGNPAAEAMANPKMLEMLGGFTVIRMINLMGAAGPKVEWKKEDLLGLNAQLNKIKRVD